MYRNKKNGIIGIIITIIILILVVIFSNGETNSNFIENAATNLIMPIQNGLTYLKNKLGGNNTFFTDINNLKDENKELKQKNSELEQSLRELENIKTQNETLKEYLNLTEKYGEYKTIPGYVINKDISNYSKTIIINIGKKDGVEEMYIPTDANIIQGDSIETSGLGGIYPKGIHIGTVKKVTNTQNMTDRYALVETAVDFDKLDTVLVITNK